MMMIAMADLVVTGGDEEKHSPAGDNRRRS